MNTATQVWLAFDAEHWPLLRRMAARKICRHAYEAAQSGIPMPKLDSFPSVWCEPFERIACRFRLFDFGSAMLRAYYQDKEKFA